MKQAISKFEQLSKEKNRMENRGERMFFIPLLPIYA